MRFFTRFAVVLAVAASVAVSPSLLAQRQGGPGAAQGPSGGRGRQGAPPAPRDDDRERGRRPQVPAGTAVIRGRVVSATTGTAVRRASIVAVYVPERGVEAGRNTQTDDNGAFELRNLAAGRWTLRASKTGYIDQQFGQRSAFATTDPIVLDDGQQFVADFRLSRGGAIAGRVVDEFGDPLAGANVTALRVQNTAQGIRTTRTGVPVPSDDNGAYRIYNLPPGQYYVSLNDPSAARMIVISPDGDPGSILKAESISISGQVTLSNGERRSYAPTYYPGTVTLADAQRITLGLGEEQSGINLAVVPARAARIAGRVVGSNGQPIRATISLHSRLQAFSPSGGRNGSGTDGTFTLTSVPPGDYLLNVLGPNVGATPPEVASMPIVVDGSDITGLTIVTGSAAAIQGLVVSDNGMKLPDARIRVTAVPADSSLATFMPRGDVNANGTFELAGLLGVYTFRFESLPAGWMVKSVTANGIDISDIAAEFRPADRVSMRVELTDRVTQVTGTVRSDRAVKGGTVVVFADDPAKWTAASRFVKTARLTESGQFTVSGLPPHQRYLAVAVDFIEQDEPQNPDFLQRAKAAAATFSLSAGDQKVLDLPLVVR
ncbi:MAG: MSCRAMM family protein [Vicinamibacterales bacterium]